MSYSPKVFVGSLISFTVAVALLVFLVLSSQVVMAVLPAVGMGGVFLQADDFSGENAVVYPEYGQLSSEYPDRVTDTATCKQRPMIALELNNAAVNGYSVFKDIKLPYFENHWMSVVIKQPNGAITTPSDGTITIFATQLQTGTLEVDNVKISEGTSENKWGDRSGEFLLEGDPNDDVSGTDLRATNIKVWTHAITGDKINFDSPNGFTIDVDYSATADLHNRYDSMGILQNVDVERENYFDCLPGQPALRQSPLLSEDFDSGSVPGGWTTEGSTAVSTQTSNSGSYSVRLDGNDDVLATPNQTTTNEVGLSVNYWVEQASNSLSNLPETEEYLIVEFRDERGEWNPVDTFEGGSASSGATYEGGFAVPEGGYHPNFAVRFRTRGGQNSADYWYIDDVEIG